MRLLTPLRSPFSWVALLLLTACSDDGSPEQQVRAVIESMEVAAEARDVGDLMEHISASYRDAQGQDRTEASRYARGYFIANQSVHLLTRVESLEFPAPDAPERRAKLVCQPTCTTSIWPWSSRTASGKSVTRTGGRIDAGVDLCNMRSILRVVFNGPPAQHSTLRSRGGRSRAAEPRRINGLTLPRAAQADQTTAR
jgi:hypothetical protein